MSYIAFLCVSIFREVFLECLPGVLVELGTIIVSESVEQSTPADMVSSDVSNTWGINTGGGTYSTFFSMSYWVNLLPKIPVADPKKPPLATACFLSIFGVYTSTPVLLGSIRLSDIPVDLFDSRLPTNSFYLVCEQLESLFLDLLQWNISQTRQHSWKDIAPFPIEKIWHHCWVVSTEFMLFSSVLSKWIRANWTTLISH